MFFQRSKVGLFTQRIVKLDFLSPAHVKQHKTSFDQSSILIPASCTLVHKRVRKLTSAMPIKMLIFYCLDYKLPFQSKDNIESLYFSDTIFLEAQSLPRTLDLVLQY